MDPAPYSTEVSSVKVSGSFGKREELLFPSSSPVLTSAISSTLFASSISSLRSSSRERQVPAAAAPPSPHQSVKFPPQQQMQRGMTGGRVKVDEVLGWQEVKRSGRGESQGRNTNWPPLETSESSSSGSQIAVGLRGVGQDMSRSEGKGFKSNYKTVLCEFWNTTGRCQYGAECHFAHGESELKRQREVNRVQQMQQQRSKKEGRVAGGTAMKSEEQRRAADKAREELKRREEEEVIKQWEAATRRTAGVSAQNQASKGKLTSRRHPGL